MVKYGKGTSRHLSELTQEVSAESLEPAMQWFSRPISVCFFSVWNYCISRSILNGGKHLTIWQE